MGILFGERTIQSVIIKDKRWIKTRERLMRAGFELLGQQGAGPFGVEDIASLAGISKQTFYNHFMDREAYLKELRRQSRQIFEEIVARNNAGVENPVDRLSQGVAIHARMAIIDPLHARFFSQFHVAALDEEAALNADLVADLEEGREKGLFRFTTIEAAVSLTGAVTQALVARLLELEHKAMVVPVTQEMLTMLLAGLGLPLEASEQKSVRMTNAIFMLKADKLAA
ncbi:TetR/AcrR family transcriptional regulator [Sphingomonas sp. LaA6.9]|uniref:TetR/AcrR family transcriptional regulator n=1 Tax=Sphingomonas sp. LaA6.9 TaxID=2919914 RepID=UPI001F4FD5B1|nr:TetR/AcrR family transcriptional regulator [Sphingomonas sp. LaA6.9]MCJ8158293.1 TetR/AcrR family transcriptional regulator [Sphingomonas sp. LaA6.9]